MPVEMGEPVAMTTTDVTSTNEVVRLDALPEPGQLVEVRRRQRVVTDVFGGALSPANDGGQHLVGLSSLDEDSMGKESSALKQSLSRASSNSS